MNKLVHELKHDHSIAAQLIDELAGLSIAYSENPPVVPGKLAAVLRSLADHYCSRIWTEDYMLFPITERAVSESEQRLLREKFKQVEVVIGSDVHQAFVMLADKLEALVEYRNAYPVSPAA